MESWWYALLLLRLILSPSPAAGAGRPTDGESVVHGGRKDDFESYLNAELKALKRTKCQGFDEEAAWNQYCEERTVRSCPVNETTAFYHRHCAVDFVVRRILQLPASDYETVDMLTERLEYAFDTLPDEACGYSTADYCHRETTVCDRSINPEGACRPMKSLCESEHYKERCSRTAQVYLLKNLLLDHLTVYEFAYAAPRETNGNGHSNLQLTFMILISVLMVLCLIASVICILTWRRNRRAGSSSSGSSPLNRSKEREPVAKLVDGQSGTSRASSTGTRTSTCSANSQTTPLVADV